MKKIISLIVVSMLIFSSTIMASANSTNIMIDGKNVEYNELSGKPFVDAANRTQVPFRQTLESLGATINWDTTRNVAVAQRNGITVEVPIGQNYIIKDGVEIPNDTAALLKDGRTYLPIRAVLEAFGLSVGWDNTTKSVTVSTSGITDTVKPTTMPLTTTQTVTNATSNTVTQAEAVYVGNSNTNKYHKLDCRYVKTISPEHVVYFKTEAAAISQGYVPCKVCNP